jgi:ABC-type uncharacterized transport system permease subunit
MTTHIFAIISICSYLGAAGLLVRHLYQSQTNRIPIGLAWLAVGMQAVAIGSGCQQHGGFNFGFFSAAALVAMIVAVLLLVAILNKPVEKLGIAVFPIAALMLGFDTFFSAESARLPDYGWAMSIHILTSIIAFSLLNIAALQAVLLAIQDQQIKSHAPKRFIRSLPSLQAMESLLFQMLAAGLLFLTIALTSGFAFIEDLFAQHLVHKTVLSLLAWLIFSSVLMGRRLYGWRGKTAIKWTLTGFGLLMLAYFGSKLVLELILHR